MSDAHTGTASGTGTRPVTPNAGHPRKMVSLNKTRSSSSRSRPGFMPLAVRNSVLVLHVVLLVIVPLAVNLNILVLLTGTATSGRLCQCLVIDRSAESR